MPQIRAPRDAGNVPINLFLNRDGPVTGATAVVAVRDGATGNSYLDFADDTFKTSGWTTRQASLTELSAGIYSLSGGLDLSAITNLPAATDHLVVEYEVTAPSNATGVAEDVLLIDDRVEDLNDLSQADVQSAMTAQGYTAARAAFLDNLDVLVSSRAAPGDEMGLADGAITAAKIATAAITAAKFAGSAITSTVLADGAITAAKIASNAITSTKLATGAITASKFAGGAINAAAIATDAITAAKIATDAITAAKIAADAIGASELAADAVSEIADAVWDEALSGHTTAGSAGQAAGMQLYDDGEVVAINIDLDAAHGSPGTTPFVNGTVANPVDNLADARTLADTLGLRAYVLKGDGGGITLTQEHVHWVFVSKEQGSFVDCNGQDVGGSVFRRVGITGDMVVSGLGVFALNSFFFGGVTGFLGVAVECGFLDTTALAAGTATFVHCLSSNPTLTAPVIDMVGAGRSLNNRGWSGPVQYNNLVAGEAICSDFDSGVMIVDASCTGGTIAVRGVAVVTDNSGGAVTINEDARVAQDRILSDATPFPGASIDATVSSRASAADLATLQSTVDDLKSATILAELTAAAGSSATEVRTDATEADDFYNDAQLVVIGGSGVAVRGIIDYANANGAFTVEALPFTPGAGDTVLVVGRTASSQATVDNSAIADAVWDELLSGHTTSGSAGDALERVRKFLLNRAVVNGTDTQVDIYEDNGTTIAFSFTISADRRERDPI